MRCGFLAEPLKLKPFSFLFKRFQTIDGCDKARYPLLFYTTVREIVMSVLAIIVYQTSSQTVLRSCFDDSPQRHLLYFWQLSVPNPPRIQPPSQPAWRIMIRFPLEGWVSK